jgi:hypothetical protein
MLHIFDKNETPSTKDDIDHERDNARCSSKRIRSATTSVNWLDAQVGGDVPADAAQRLRVVRLASLTREADSTRKV